VLAQLWQRSIARIIVPVEPGIGRRLRSRPRRGKSGKNNEKDGSAHEEWDAENAGEGRPSGF
jgi:hypothetical protein